MSEVVLRAVLAAVAVMGQSRLPGLVNTARYRLWLHTPGPGNGSSAAFVFSSSKSTCLGLFAGGSITCVSHFTKCHQSRDTVANLKHIQAGFLFWKSWWGPRCSPLSSLLQYLICASEPDSSCSKFFLYVFHQPVKGMRHILLSQSLPDVSQKGEKYNMRCILLLPCLAVTQISLSSALCCI